VFKIISDLWSDLKAFRMERKYRGSAEIASLNAPHVSPEDIGDYRTAYERIETVHRCVELLVNGLTEVPYIVDSGAKLRFSTMLNESPNPWEDRTRFFRNCYLDFILDGNCFIYYERETNSLFRLPANYVTVFPHPTKMISHYELMTQISDPFGGAVEGVKVRYEADTVIHIRSDDARDSLRGDSKLKAIDPLIKLYNQMTLFQQRFFQNNAIPGMVLKTDHVLSKTVKARLLHEWHNSYGNIFKGARSPAILDGGLEIDSFSSFKFSELDFENSIKRVQEGIATALGVPASLLNPGNNIQVAGVMSSFYLTTIMPILDLFGAAFTHRLNAKIYADKQAISALRPDTEKEGRTVTTLVNGGVITPNEGRLWLRFDPLAGDENNLIRVPQNIAGSALDASQGGRPEESEEPELEESKTVINFNVKESPTPVLEIVEPQKWVSPAKQYGA
jgi:HK97 family phage portal protein